MLKSQSIGNLELFHPSLFHSPYGNLIIPPTSVSSFFSFISICKCTGPFVHMWRSEISFLIDFLYHSSLNFWDAVSHWTGGSPFCLGWLTCKPPGSTCLCSLPSAGSTGTCHCTCLLLENWESKSSTWEMALSHLSQAPALSLEGYKTEKVKSSVSQSTLK